MPLSNAKDYNQLTPANTLDPKAKAAFAQPGKTELETAELQDVAARVAQLITDGALTEANAVMGAFKNQLADKLTLKGAAGLSGASGAVDFLNAVDKMDVTGSKELWCGDYWDQRTGNYTTATFFYPVPNSNIVISVAQDKIIRVNDMTEATQFPSSKQLTYDAGGVTAGLSSMGFAVNHNGTKIAYQKDNNTLAVISVDYSAWEFTVQEYTHNLNKGMYEAGYATLNREGTVYGFKSGYGTYTFLRLTDNVSATVTDSGAIHSSGANWLIWTGEYKACYLYNGSNQFYDWVINPDTMAVTITQSAITTGWAIPNTGLAVGSVNYDAELGLVYRVNGAGFDVYESGIPTANRPGFYRFRTPLHLYFLDGGISKTVYFSWAMWTVPSSNRTVLNYPAVFMRKLNDDTLRFYVSDTGYVDYVLSEQKFDGKRSPDGSVFLGNAVKIIMTSGGDAAQIDTVFVSEKMDFMVGTYGHLSSNVYCCQNRPVYKNKIIGEWIQRNGTYTLLQRAPATEEDLQSGALDPADTVLKVTDGGGV